MNSNSNIQNGTLQVLVKNKTPVAMFLKWGVKLQGTITGFDNHALLLELGGVEQLVYKHSVATVMPEGTQ
jgi:host factor-I protein